MRTPDLAVIVPAYNEEASIGQTLDALYNQQRTDSVAHIVVDNASTDNTRAVCEQFVRVHDDFPLTIVDESRKGTGYAVDTGFRYAIDQNIHILGRTDADTLPMSNWTEVISQNFKQNPNLQLLGGSRIPRKDDGWYRSRDAILWPLGVFAGRRLRFGDKGTGIIIGNNLATRADAYVETGGFPHVAINETDEDREYERRIGATYGRESIVLDPQMKVATSMRRLRELGYLGLAHYRISPQSRQKHTDVDVRPTTSVEVITIPQDSTV